MTTKCSIEIFEPADGQGAIVQFTNFNPEDTTAKLTIPVTAPLEEILKDGCVHPLILLAEMEEYMAKLELTVGTDNCPSNRTDMDIINTIIAERRRVSKTLEGTTLLFDEDALVKTTTHHIGVANNPYIRHINDPDALDKTWAGFESESGVASVKFL